MVNIEFIDHPAQFIVNLRRTADDLEAQLAPPPLTVVEEPGWKTLPEEVKGSLIGRLIKECDRPDGLSTDEMAAELRRLGIPGRMAGALCSNGRLRRINGRYRVTTIGARIMSTNGFGEPKHPTVEPKPRQ